MIFKDFPDKMFPVGEEVKVLVVLTNNGLETFELQQIGANLHSQFDYTYYLQNYSTKAPNAVLEPNEQISVEYTFLPSENLEPLEFWLSGYVDYNDTTGNYFRTTFHNGTVELVEKPSVFDVKQFVTFALAIAAVGLVAYIGFNVSTNISGGKKSGKKQTKRPRKETGTSSDAADGNDDWGGPMYTAKQKSRPVSRKKSKSRRKK